MSKWGLTKVVAKALGDEGYYSNLLGLTDEVICSFSELKKGEMAALHTAVVQLQADRGGRLLAPKTATPAPSQHPSALLCDLLKTNADDVDIGARATSKVDLKPQACLLAHPQSDHHQQQATAKQEQNQRQSADQVGHSPSIQLNSSSEPQNPFTREFLGNY